MEKEIREVSNSFLECFAKKSYNQNASVKLTSGVDDSVTFIGSGISVLKPKLLSKGISNSGEYITQKAIRTHTLKNIYDFNLVNEFYSFFEALCVLRKYDDLNLLVKDTFEYLQQHLGISEDELKIRILSSDYDLMAAIYENNLGRLVEQDTRQFYYYRHRYGLDDLGIYGRNFNIAILDKGDGIFKDVGNIVAIESETEKYACEFAVGVQPLVMRINGISLSIQASYIADILPLKTPQQIKFAECLVVVANLIYENVFDIKKRFPIYLYKKYYKALEYWAKELEIDTNTINKMIEDYLKLEYNRSNVSIPVLELKM